MIEITETRIRELFEKYGEHEEDMIECGRRVRKFLDGLLIIRSLAEVQKDEIIQDLANLDQALGDVKKSRRESHGHPGSQGKKQQMVDDETRLRIQLSLTKSLLVKYLEREPVPEEPIAEPPIGGEKATQKLSAGVSDEEIQIHLDAIERKPDDDSSYNGLGNVYYRKGAYEKAIEYFQQAIRRNRNISTYYLNLADAYSRLKRWDDAISNYNVGISMNDKDDWGFYGLANALMAKDNPDKAIENYLKAIQIRPQLIYYDHIGDAYRALNYLGKAVDYYKQALGLRANDVWAHNGLGLCFLSLKDYESAIKHFKQAVRHSSPKYSIYYFNLGVAHSNLGEHDKAIENYEEALNLDPDDYKTLAGLGDSKVRKKQYEDAIKHFDKAISLNPEPNPDDYEGLGDAYRKLGKSKEAIENYKKALKINPKYDMGFNGMGLVFLSEGKNQEAADKFKQAIIINPNNFAYHSNLGIALAKMGKLNDAMDSLKKAVELNPKDNISYESLGLCYHRLGLFSRAIEQFEAALNIKQLPLYYSDIGVSYRSQKNWEKAFEYLKKARELDPTNKIILSDLVFAYNAKGTEHYKNKEDDKAIEYYNRALQLEPRSDVIHANLYVVYLAKNKYAKAEDHLKKAISLNPNREEYKHFLTQLKAKRDGA